MKAAEALKIAKELRAEGVRRVEFDGDDVKALEFHDENAAPTGDDTPSEGDPERERELDQQTAGFERALEQLNTGRFRKETNASPEEEAS